MEGVDLDTGSELTVDLERKLIVTPDGREVPFELDESTRFRLLNGLDDIGLTLQHEEDITAYETAARDRVSAHVAALPGDGIGPEVMAEALRVLDAFGIEHSSHPFGGNAILEQGTPLPDETLAACRDADAMLLAAVGLPELEGKPVRPEQGLLALRQGARRLRQPPPRAAEGIDLLIVRELTGGLYFGAKGTRDDGTWFDTCEYTRPEVERIARRAFELTRGRAADG